MLDLKGWQLLHLIWVHRTADVSKGEVSRAWGKTGGCSV